MADAEPALLVTLDRDADTAALLGVRATTLRVLDPSARRYLIAEIPATAPAAAAALADATVRAVWASSHREATSACAETVTVWDPALGALDDAIAAHRA